MFDFTGQNVIITGATRGIGKEISLSFLKAGAKVIGVYGGNEDAAKSFHDSLGDLSENFNIYKCDVSDESAVKDFYEFAYEKFDSLDILVNNAGIRKDSVLALMSYKDWQSVIDVNLTGSFLMAKEAVLFMMRNKYGRIINITSPVSYLGFAGQANYSASKAGQVAMTKTLAKETAKKKITVNCVSPGFIDTDLLSDLPPEQKSQYKKMVPMKRFGKTEEVASAVLYLSSPAASYITGSVLEVNGGL